MKISESPIDPCIDVRVCNSHLCSVCRLPNTGIKFIKVSTKAPKKQIQEEQTPMSSDAPTKSAKLASGTKLIIENILSLGTDPAFNTEDQKHPINQTESASDDESVLNFIESIEN